MGELVENSKKLGIKYADAKGAEKRISTTQLRKIFSEISRVKFEWKKNEKDMAKLITQLQLLKPKLAYIAGKARKKEEQNALDNLKKDLEDAIDKVINSKSEDEANNFFIFVESILAYHKYYSTMGVK